MTRLLPRHRSPIVAASLLVAALVLMLVAPSRAQEAPDPVGADQAVIDSYAADYYDLLLRHTRFTETTWNEEAGHYPLANFTFTNILGHAVLLRFGQYDEDVAGFSRDELRRRTLSTIEKVAATNRFVDPVNGQWGARIYWDSTFEGYFVAAAKLLWDDLDPQTRDNVDRIIEGTADFIVDLGASDGNTNGLAGAHVGNSRIEEMAAKSTPVALGLAYQPDDASAGDWREWLNLWTLNQAGLPAADEANPAVIDGRLVAEWNQAHNIFDTFVVENHGSYAPIYQESTGAFAGRNVTQFLIAGQPVPEALTAIPNDTELWRTLRHLGTSVGLPAHLMVADRHRLYGREALPLTYRTTVLGDPYAARAERMLLDHLGPYLAYPPENRLTKFSGEPHYEPEARAEVAMSFLLHQWKDRLAGPVEPVSAKQLFAAFSGATDYGRDVGMIAHQTPRAVSAAVSKPGFVKFAYLPDHDEWLFNVAGTNPALIPSTSAQVQNRSAHEYRQARDGVDSTATMLTLDTGYAGFTTLPDGTTVYATSGLAPDEGRLTVANLTMPGVDGLDGDRTYTAADGSVTLAEPRGLGDGGLDQLEFQPVTARYVRFLGAEHATRFGYSIFEFEVYGPDGTNLALGQPTTASSYDTRGPFSPEKATDGDPATRWAVSLAERPRTDSWLQVDLGAPTTINRARINFENAYAKAYRIQVSDDEETWRDAVAVPETREFESNWLNVDGRAGFVMRGSGNPVKVSPTSIALSAGPADAPEQTAAAADQPAPHGGPEQLRASLAGGHLSLFNLGGTAIDGATLTLPQGREAVLFRGVQTVQDNKSAYQVALAAADARVEPPRFHMAAADAGPMPEVRAEVLDSGSVRLANLEESGVARLTVTSVATGEQRTAAVPAARQQTMMFDRGTVTPTDDLARARTTFPTSPLPEGMSDPDNAVDGDPDTVWRPGGTTGRMVVDLGTVRNLGAAVLTWAPGAPADATVRAEVSTDGLSWTEAGSAAVHEPRQVLKLDTAARYLAVEVTDSVRAPALAAVEVFQDTLRASVPEQIVYDPSGAANVPVTVRNIAAGAVEDVSVELNLDGAQVTPTQVEFGPMDSGATATADFAATWPTPGARAATATTTMTWIDGKETRASTVSTDVEVTCAPTPTRPQAVTHVDSEETAGGDNAAVNAIDGDPSTIWHTEWFTADPPPPHEIQLDLGSTRQVCGLRYLPRPGGGNGTVADYEVYLSQDGTTWGQPVATGTFPPGAEEKWIPFAETQARYVRFVALSEVNDNPWTSAAEISVDAR